MQMHESYPVPTSPPSLHLGQPATKQFRYFRDTPFEALAIIRPFLTSTAPTFLRAQFDFAPAFSASAKYFD
jgi:hypothetical protein